MNESSTIIQTSAFNTRRWILISISNLFLVAVLGVLMRYKIAYSFPYLEQKYLLEAHSHFAFAGWVSQTLMVLMIGTLKHWLKPSRISLYQKVLWANLASAVGMLISFSMQGYGPYSIIFSTAFIIITFYFSYLFYFDLKKSGVVQQKHWFNAGMLFNLVSTLGTAALVHMMVTKNVPQQAYLASVYWYLHFQYNGWFLFTCLGLFIHFATQKLSIKSPPTLIFWLFAGSCVPAFGLSVLWLMLPVWIYVLVVAASVAQFAGWVLLLKNLKSQGVQRHTGIDWVSRVLLWGVGFALSIKLSLQLASVIPQVSQLTFGFRPIVIAYLHLILLAIISLYLVVHCYMNGYLLHHKRTTQAVLLFAGGVFANEAILGIQGIASFSYTVIPYTNEMLLAVSAAIMVAIAMLLWSQAERFNLKK